MPSPPGVDVVSRAANVAGHRTQLVPLSIWRRFSLRYFYLATHRCLLLLGSRHLLRRAGLSGLAVMLPFVVSWSALGQGMASQPTTDEELPRRMASLESKLDIIEAYNDDFLSTVYWSLGSVGALAVLLVGFAWFANFRLLEREKSALRAEIEAAISGRLHEIETQLRGEVGGALTSIEKKIAETANTAAEAATRKLGADLGKLKGTVYELRYEHLEREIERWVSQGVLGNALMSATELVQMAITAKDIWQLPMALDQLQNILRRFSGGESRTRIDADNVQRVESVIKRISEQHGATAEAIRRLLTAAQDA